MRSHKSSGGYGVNPFSRRRWSWVGVRFGRGWNDGLDCARASIPTLTAPTRLLLSAPPPTIFSALVERIGSDPQSFNLSAAPVVSSPGLISLRRRPRLSTPAVFRRLSSHCWGVEASENILVAPPEVEARFAFEGVEFSHNKSNQRSLSSSESLALSVHSALKHHQRIQIECKYLLDPAARRPPRRPPPSRARAPLSCNTCEASPEAISTGSQ